MTPKPPIDAAGLAAIEAQHFTDEWRPKVCMCGCAYPCPTARVAASLRQAWAEIEVLKNKLNTTVQIMGMANRSSEQHREGCMCDVCVEGPE